MKKIFYFILFLLVLFSYTQAFAIDEQELKAPLFHNNSEKEQSIKLKGNIREDVAKVKPLTGIGVIGLRFIHQVGFPSYIEEVYANSPASRAGLRPRDLIFSIDGIRTENLNSDSVYQLLSGEPGTKVKVFITRGTSMLNLELIREDLANFSPEIQNRYLSGPITVPVNPQDFFPYH
ncbi:MAG: PDZ domain-containing protein [Candidatus Melainabacteria bacterium]|nr:PDZ domain-containing protein [Candidatus Melainabacteria bacterium]